LDEEMSSTPMQLSDLMMAHHRLPLPPSRKPPL
jgi:hypothetical protein